MNQTRSQQIQREATKRRRSAWVTIGVASALVIGTPVLFYQCSEDEDPVAEGQSYSNNHYVPGAGYYHAGYHNFFPFRHNHFDADRSRYFYGGNWHSSPDSSSRLTSSVPSRSAVTSANQQYHRTQGSSRGGFGKSGGYFSGRS